MTDRADPRGNEPRTSEERSLETLHEAGSPLRALVLAAGFGTRFRPATLTTPKPLLPFLGVPILNWLLDHLISQGVTGFVLNAHHLGERLRAGVGSSFGGVPVEWSFEDPILGTAGAIRRAGELSLLPDEHFVVANGDLFTTLSLSPLLSAASRPGIVSAMAVVPNLSPERETPLWSSNRGRLVAVGGPSPGPGARGPWLFTGLQVARRVLLSRIPEGFAELAKDVLVPSTRKRDGAFALVPYRLPENGLWFDLGTPERLSEAEDFVRRSQGAGRHVFRAATHS